MSGNLTPLPSLNALRAFEAMARTGAATRAARELGVTHGAVSRQVKALEAALGVRLFQGPRHRLELTEAGRALAVELTRGFDVLTTAVARTRSDGMDLHIAVHASLSVKWLIPRLADFAERVPGVRLHLSALEPEAVSHPGAELAIRLMDRTRAEALGGIILAENEIGPVIRADRVAEYAAASRLVSRTHPRAWRDWQRLSGGPLPGGPERPVEHLHFAVDAALAGWGVAALPRLLVQGEIEKGHLAAPHGFIADAGVLVALPQGEGGPARRAFLAWLKDQI